MAQNRKVEIQLTAVDKTKAAFRSAAQSVKAFGGTVSKYLGQLGLAFGVGGGGLLANISRIAQQFDAIAKTAAKLGTTTEELSKLRYAGELTGVAARTLDTALQRMTRRLSEAAKGAGEAKGAIKELGLDAKALAEKSPEEAFKDIADAMALVPKQSDRVRLAFKLFDSEGVVLVNTLAQGREGIEAMGEELEALGGVIDSEAAAAAERLTDNLTRMDRAFAGLSQTIGNEFIPAISESVEFWNTLAQDGSMELALQRMESSGLTTSQALNDVNVELATARQRLKDLQDDQDGRLGFLVPDYALDETKENIKRLEKERTEVIEQEAARRAAQRQRQAKIEGYKEEVARQDGVKQAKKATASTSTKSAKGVKSVTGDPLIDNRLAAQRGDISTEEYRRNRSELIRQSGPSAPAGPTSYGSISPEQVAQMIAEATERAMASRAFTIKVKPELVGLEGVDVATIDTADKEGSHE